MSTKEQYIQVDGHRIETLQIGDIDPNKPTLVFVHGGLDCIDMWRQFPMRLCRKTGLAAILYSRWGHGKSDKLVLPRDGDVRSIEAGQPLKEIFKYFNLGKVVLVGHSFGGAISLIASSIHRDRIYGTISIAPQLIPGEDTRAGVEKAIAAYENGKLRVKLMEFHGENTDSLFHYWSTASSKPGFVSVDYSSDLRKITCSVLGVYGTEDNYGYLHNLDLIKECLSCQHEVLIIPGAAHYPHLDSQELVLESAGEFVEKLVC